MTGTDEISSRPHGTRGGWWLRPVPRRPLRWIALAALPFYLLDLGAPALNDGEAMYAEVPREMRAVGDWVTPRLNGTRHFDKPPLLYWMIGAGQGVLGETELAARLWPALATWATIPVAGAIGTALYGPRAGWLGALVFATSLGPYLFGRQVMPDPILTFWVALAILGYLRGYWRGERRGVWVWILYGSLGLAALTKGVLGVGLPAAIIGLHAALGGRLRAFWSWRLVVGAALAGAFAVPWHAAVARANPDFLGYYLLREHLLRFTGQRYPPDEFLSLPLFLGFTVLWMFPWLAFLPPAVWRGVQRLRAKGRRPSEDLLPLVWAGVVVAVFAASRSRLEYYALPALPAFALLVGRFWDEVWESPASSSGGPSLRDLRAPLAGMAALTLLAAAAALVVLGPAKDHLFRWFTAAWPASGWLGAAEEVAIVEKLRVPAMVTLAGAAAFTAGSLAAVRRGRPGLACGLLAGMMAPVLALVHWGFLQVEPFQSTRAVAEIVRRAAGPQDPVVFQEPHEYMWVGGITFYARRPVYILKDPRFEGVAARRREPPERFLDQDALLDLWTSGRGVVVVADAAGGVPAVLHQARPAVVLGQSSGRVVLRPSTAGRQTHDAGR